ncbi:hypothetical protein HNS03_16475 [Amorphus sp. 3PC139-8]
MTIYLLTQFVHERGAVAVLQARMAAISLGKNRTTGLHRSAPNVDPFEIAISERQNQGHIGENIAPTPGPATTVPFKPHFLALSASPTAREKVSAHRAFVGNHLAIIG